MNSSLYMIVDLIFRLATMLFLVRFLLQACAADFYNPISQAIVKGSDGIAAPLRRLLPKTGRVDLDSVNPSWLIFSDGFSAGRRLSSIAKRIFDIMTAVVTEQHI